MKALEEQALCPAQRLYLARRYGIQEWIPIAIRALLLSSLVEYTAEDHRNLGFDIFNRLIIGMETISKVRRQLSAVPLYPSNLDEAPHCSDPSICKSIWADHWFKDIVIRLIIPPVPYFPLSKTILALRSIDHKGMHINCKDYVLEWMEKLCPGLEKEEKAIRQVISDIENDNYVNGVTTQHPLDA